jgi:hypothetical protein
MTCHDQAIRSSIFLNIPQTIVGTGTARCVHHGTPSNNSTTVAMRNLDAMFGYLQRHARSAAKVRYSVIR